MHDHKKSLLFLAPFIIFGFIQMVLAQIVIGPPPMGGTLTSASPSCDIAVGASTCDINFFWNVMNPQNPGGSAVTKPVNVTVATGDVGFDVPLAVKFISETFYLYNNSVELAQVTVTSDCIAGSYWSEATETCEINGDWSAWSDWGECSTTGCGGTQTRSRTCDNPPPSPGGDGCSGSSTDTQSCNGPSCVAVTLTADPTTIVAGGFSTLRWTSPAEFCEGTNFTPPPFVTTGSILVTPDRTTTYSIYCAGGGFAGGSASTTITVTGGKGNYGEF
ncbi:thrombospondin type-1 domain-containing protein [Candidatus Nomurabacteria bacterium]|nr:thrombospondin type-1 domain-containing protein [Candidatus Nomurabacteria bacterium]